MDSSQLVTIAVTAVVSVIAKELIVWGVGLCKNLAVIKTAKEKIKAAFSAANRKVWRALFRVTATVGFLIFLLTRDTPLERFDIFAIVVVVLAIVVVTVELLYQIGAVMVAREKAAAAEKAANEKQLAALERESPNSPTNGR